MLSLVVLSLVSGLILQVQGKPRIHAASDLQSYKSRPDLKAPKLFVKNHTDNPDLITPGYFFMAPYAHSDINGKGIYAPCQQGPAIFDQDGELVWSGACDFRKSHDFRVSDCDDGPGACLSLTSRELKWPDGSWRGGGAVMNRDYEITNRIDYVHYDLHEFNILPGGDTAMYCRSWTKSVPFDVLGPEYYMNELVTWTSIVEVDLHTKKTLFKWHTPEHLPLNHSAFKYPSRPGQYSNHPWDYNHLNAVDKNENGDYITSFRHCNCIVMLNGKNGKVKWQIGGNGNQFKLLEDVEFSRQHNVRFVESHKDYTIFSFLDNADAKIKQKNMGLKPKDQFSRGMIVKANHPKGKPTTAELVHHYDHPEGRYTLARGNMQILPNENVFMGWSTGGYQSEHTKNGTLVQTSGYLSKRWNTYRSYKYEYELGEPQEVPWVAAEAYGTTPLTITTTFWVSWNGDARVRTWSFYSAPKSKGKDNSTFLGNCTRKGFETTWMFDGFAEHVWAEGFDKDGKSLSTTNVQDVLMPEDWREAGFDGEEEPSKEMFQQAGWNDWRKMAQNKIKEKITVVSVDVPVIIFVVLPMAALIPWLMRRRILLFCSYVLRRLNSHVGYQRVPGVDHPEMGGP